MHWKRIGVSRSVHQLQPPRQSVRPFGPLPGRGGEGGKKVLALIPLNLDGFLFSADYQSGKKAEITSRVAANFVGWEKDHALFDRQLVKVIRALRTGEDGREKPPPARL